MESVMDYRTLSSIYSKTKSELDETKKSLSKLLGSQRSQFSVSSGYQKRPNMSSGRNLSLQTSVKQSQLNFSRESIEESESDDGLPSKKAALQSAVVAQRERVKSRRDVIHTQNLNRKMQSRNRRMFGMVLNTLQQFQDEEVKRQPQDLKRLKALQKVEAAQTEEKELAKRQRIELFSKTKEKEIELKCLEKMMKVTESFELWETNQKYLLNYIVTETKPQICFLPAISSSSSQKHLERSNVEIKENIERQKTYVERALASIRESYEEEKYETLKTDSSQKVAEQITETYATQKETKPTEESLNLDLSDDESNFVIDMLY